MTLRRVLLVWHRWFGLVAALWLLLLAVTGTIIVFDDELDGALNPDLRTVAAAGRTPLSADALRERIEAQLPGTALDYMLLPTAPDQSVLAFVAPRIAPGQPYPSGYVFQQTYADPYDGRILGTRVFGEAGVDRRRIVQFLYQLHMDLSLGPVATWLLGLLALGWTIDHIASAILALPAGTRWRQAFAVKARARGFRLHFDLHRAIGLWLFPVTLVIAVSGLALTWTQSFDKAVSLASPITPFPVAGLTPLPQRDYTPAIGLDRAVAIARDRAGGAQVHAISFHPDLGVWWLRLFDPRDIDDLGSRWIVVRHDDGRVIADRHETEGTGGDVFKAWLFPLHGGRAFGWTGRLIIAASGLLLAGVIVTGLLIFARKLRSRRRSSRRRMIAANAY